MSKIPFENLRFRIHNLPKDVPILDEFPELQKYADLKATKLNQNKMLRFLIYFCDPKSDLIRETPQFAERKAKALKLAGYTVKDGRFVDDEADVILNGSDKDFHEEIRNEILNMTFCMVSRVYHDRKFREWFTLQEELDENTRARLTKISDGNDKATMEAHQKKGLLRQQATSIHQEIDALEKEIFGDDEELKEHAITVRLTSPERVAAAYAGIYEVE